jgi:hypothetical protein
MTVRRSPQADHFSSEVQYGLAIRQPSNNTFRFTRSINELPATPAHDGYGSIAKQSSSIPSLARYRWLDPCLRITSMKGGAAKGSQTGVD